MELRKIFTKKGLIFFILFSGLTLVGMKINFSPLVGAENQFFTLFQFFGPIAGGFLGALVGALAALIAQLANFFIAGKAFSIINIIRFAPMFFAAYYFGSKKRNLGIAVPLIAMAAFIIHPVGRQVWFFSLFWAIPIIAKVIPKKYSESIISRSFGSTFTAHAVGGALWIWTVPMTAGQWIALIPVVIVERSLFAGGIAVSYISLNAVLDKVLDKLKINVKDILRIEKKFTLKA